jgi:hypothetical protein
MRWLKSAADLAVDVITGVALSVAALIDDWRAER